MYYAYRHKKKLFAMCQIIDFLRDTTDTLALK
jgi:hypothetical protein